MTRLMRADAPPLILASNSAARRAMLANAGLAFMVMPANVDEAAAKQALLRDCVPAEQVAIHLAELKARDVSIRMAGALVVGGDQVLDCDGVLFDKPETRDAARTQLMALSGQRHRLISAVCLARDGVVIWRHAAHADLTMRDFDGAFAGAYLDAVGDAVLASVGAYQLEGLGIQLFAGVAGDYFTILGLPLLPLLAELRLLGVLA